LWPWQGSRHTGIVAVADWYATLCGLARVDPTDIPANKSVPATDSIDVWASLMVPNSSASPRRTVFLSYQVPGSAYGAGRPGHQEGGLIIGDAKIVCGVQAMQNFWQSPCYPNSSSSQVSQTAL
jgi:hypothetical protein